MKLALRRPCVELVPSYFAMTEEMLQAGETLWAPVLRASGETDEMFVARVSLEESEPAAPGLVPQSTFWAVLDGEVVGRIAFRHRLNEKLATFGGHIGYEVRPSRRRRGIAKEMLRLILLDPRVRAAGRVLLTCAPTNEASNRTILVNGGVLEKTVFVESIQRETNLYWITTA